MNWEQKVAEAKERFKRNAKEKDGLEEKKKLTAEQLHIAESTIGLMADPAFKEFLKVDSMLKSSFLSNPFQKLSGTDGMSYAERMAFNNGYHRGLMELKRFMDSLWLQYSTEDK
jgi:hypothetical protein